MPRYGMYGGNRKEDIHFKEHNEIYELSYEYEKFEIIPYKNVELKASNLKILLCTYVCLIFGLGR